MRDMSCVFLFVSLLSGCETQKIVTGNDNGTGGTDSGGGTTKVDCKVTLVGNEPQDGATDVAFGTAISFTLSEADDTAEITTSIPGTQTTLEDGVTIVWQPSGALDPKTSYEVTLDWCGGSSTISFTTADSFAQNVEGKTYALELQKASVDKPAGVGGMLSGYLPEFILMGVMSADTGSIQFMGALAVADSKPIEQDVCSETLPFPSADFKSQPDFAVGPQDTVLSVGGVAATLYGMTLTGTFATPDGGSIEDGTLDGVIDLRDLGDSLPIGADQICGFVGCTACPSDGASYCIELAVSQLRGDVVDGLTLTEITSPTCAQ